MFGMVTALVVQEAGAAAAARSASTVPAFACPIPGRV
jgi:hypothetical protein